MLPSSIKQEIIQKNRKSDNDTGSPRVQVALLTESITQLTEHLKMHRNDKHSRRGLIQQVMQRRKLLNYLKKKEPNQYEEFITSLGLKK